MAVARDSLWAAGKSPDGGFSIGECGPIDGREESMFLENLMVTNPASRDRVRGSICDLSRRLTDMIKRIPSFAKQVGHQVLAPTTE
jgi:hypothetical protein